MKAISIRNLRRNGPRDNALKGMPLAITNRGALIGVFVPVAAAWIEHLINYNWSHVRQSIVEGEQSLSTAFSVVTQDGTIPEEDTIDYEQGQARRARQRTESLERLQSASNSSASGARQESRSAGPSVITVRIGDLTAHLIEETGANAQFLAVIHDRELIGVIIPVTRSLMNFLIEQNMSRILGNIALSERDIRTQDKMTTLDEKFYHAEQLIDRAERIAVSLQEGLDRLPESQQLSAISKDFPQAVAADREVASNQQEVTVNLPGLKSGRPRAPRYEAGRRDPVISADPPIASNIGKTFLCHSSSDKPSVRALRRRLLDDKIQPWFDEEDILPGQDWDLAIRKAIRASDVVLVCLSRASVSKIGYLQKEIKHVLDVADEQPEGAIFLIPVRLEPCEVPERLRRWQWVDLFEEGGYPRLLRALGTHNSD
jgi:hypothetical protein